MTVENNNNNNQPGGDLGGAVPARDQNAILPGLAVAYLPPQMFTTSAQIMDLTDSKHFPSYHCQTSGG
jgi:hypothetical protein